MSAPRPCRHEGCEAPHLPGAIFCQEHVSAKHRCKATKPGSGGKVRCKAQALAGLEVCVKHGGKFPNAQLQHERAEGLTAMERFVRPYQGELNMLDAFDGQYRMTMGRIQWLNERVAELSQEELIWGKTKYESATGATGIPSTTYEARVHIWEEMLWRERKHLLDLTKAALQAGMEQRRLDILDRQADWTYRMVIQACRMFGIDTNEPANAERLFDLFSSVERHLEIEPPQ